MITKATTAAAAAESTALQLEGWAHITECLLIDSAKRSLCDVAEPAARAAIALDYANALAAVMHQHALAVSTSAAAIQQSALTRREETLRQLSEEEVNVLERCEAAERRGRAARLALREWTNALQRYCPSALGASGPTPHRELQDRMDHREEGVRHSTNNGLRFNKENNDNNNNGAHPNGKAMQEAEDERTCEDLRDAWDDEDEAMSLAQFRCALQHLSSRLMEQNAAKSEVRTPRAARSVSHEVYEKESPLLQPETHLACALVRHEQPEELYRRVVPPPPVSAASFSLRQVREQVRQLRRTPLPNGMVETPRRPIPFSLQETFSVHSDSMRYSGQRYETSPGVAPEAHTRLWRERMMQLKEELKDLRRDISP